MLEQERESGDSVNVVEVKVEERTVSDPVENEVTEGSVSKAPPDVVVNLRSSFDGMSGVCEKVEACLSLMSECLSHSDRPLFRVFWESRKVLFELFADSSLSSADRVRYQATCKDLSREALILKDHVKEVSNFAAQQIELAIEAMQVELSKAVEIPSDWDSGVLPECLESESRFYFESHSRLLRLSALAERLRSLREEVLSISMRGKLKRKLLDSLSEVGNLLFPEKRELSRVLGERFLSDVENFVKKVMSGPVSERPALQLLSEVRRFQALAKELQLTRTTFKSARLSLSACWDRLNVALSQKKEKMEERRELSKTNCESIRLKIENLRKEYHESSLSDDRLESELGLIQREMRNVDLDRNSVIFLKRILKEARAPLLEKRENELEKRREADLQAAEEREKCLQNLRVRLSDLLERVLAFKGNDVEGFDLEYRELCDQCRTPLIWRSDRVTLDKLLKQIKHALEHRKRAHLMEISSTDGESIESIRRRLEELISCREEVRERLDSNKKSVGSSGLDLERALYLGQMMQQDKERLIELRRVIAEMEIVLQEKSRHGE
ncbi:hypothetical protein [Candidatus Similichlamydia epinepheli]|uniref:hypothetical protein n=1 Tax=Candidatus Similichlamydia epinepheli TaxID=1903953 RepID=UPI000D3D244F|nr:hypothetical protein [Candidatus Similichlamydia epinepheli]